MPPVIIAGTRQITLSVADVQRIVIESGFNVSELVCGMCRGIDMAGYEWAKANGIPIKEFPADWSQGKSAGLSRNLAMLNYAKTNGGNLIMIFDGISPGSTHCLKNAQVMGIPRFVKIVGNGREDRCLSCEDSNLILVFGSNEGGFHSRGAAHHAKIFHGAVQKQGFGIQNQCFAIPTKTKDMKILPVDVIKNYVNRFISYAKMFPQHSFYLTRIGTGLASYSDEQIAPLFAEITSNCILNETWANLLNRKI